jgi:beta-galactosidase
MDIGIAYYPEHWPRQQWETDFKLMAQAGITLARMAEFAWCRLEPREGEFDFGWLEEAIALAAQHGVRTVLCTPTEAPPPWLSVNHPETREWTPQGLPYAIGSRRNFDAASPAALHYSDAITRAMGQRFGRNPHVAGWQLDNEIGAHTHFLSSSPWMQVQFRDWLRQRYGTVEALNQAWGLVFWSGEVREWSEIELLTKPPKDANPAYLKEVRDFGQQLWQQFLARQAAILRPLCPGQFITHNIAWYGEQIDIWKLHEYLDVVGIDTYQRRAEMVTAVGDLYHAAGRGKPWAILEMPAQDGTFSTPTAAGPCRGWLTSALLKHALSGAKFASLFREAASPSGCEQFGDIGIRDQFNRPTDTVAACAAARQAIAKLQPVLERPRQSAVAILFDSDDLIFHEMQPVMGQRRQMCNDYPRELFDIHHQLTKRGHRPTFVSLDHDLSPYRLVVVWNKLLIGDHQPERLRRYVAQGGTLVGGYALGFLNQAGRRTCEPLPYRMTDLFGCTVRDLLEIAPGQAPRLDLDGHILEAARHAVTLEPLGGQVLARWEGWTGDHTAAIVAHRFGQGNTLYIGALLERAAWEQLMPLVLAQAGLAARNPIGPHPQLESFPERGCWVVYNDGHEPVRTSVTGPFRDAVTGAPIGSQLDLAGYQIRVLAPA